MRFVFYFPEKIMQFVYALLLAFNPEEQAERSNMESSGVRTTFMIWWARTTFMHELKDVGYTQFQIPFEIIDRFDLDTMSESYLYGSSEVCWCIELSFT